MYTLILNNKQTLISILIHKEPVFENKLFSQFCYMRRLTVLVPVCLQKRQQSKLLSKDKIFEKGSSDVYKEALGKLALNSLPRNLDFNIRFPFPKIFSAFSHNQNFNSR